MGIITCYICGDLGIQLFQIITTYAYALDYNYIPIFDITQKKSGYQLDPIDFYWDNVFKNISIESFKNKNNPKYKEIINKAFEIIHWNNSYKELPYFTNNIILSGYFQSYKYFHHHREYIFNLLKPSNCIKKKINNYFKGIAKNDNTVSIDIRRKNIKDKILPIEYYNEALKYFTIDNIFLIFSDDIKWCKENITCNLLNVIYVEDKDYIELYVMSKCKHNIIINSPFSWWGAYLNKNENNITIAPKKWGISNLKNEEDLLLENWILLDY